MFMVHYLFKYDVYIFLSVTNSDRESFCLGGITRRNATSMAVHLTSEGVG